MKRYILVLLLSAGEVHAMDNINKKNIEKNEIGMGTKIVNVLQRLMNGIGNFMYNFNSDYSDLVESFQQIIKERSSGVSGGDSLYKEHSSR